MLIFNTRINHCKDCIFHNGMLTMCNYDKVNLRDVSKHLIPDSCRFSKDITEEELNELGFYKQEGTESFEKIFKDYLLVLIEQEDGYIYQEFELTTLYSLNTTYIHIKDKPNLEAFLKYQGVC